mgnify:CR=1 FL=1
MHTFMRDVTNADINLVSGLMVSHGISPALKKTLIKVGMGVGILADWAIEEDSKKGDLTSLPLGLKKLTRTWGISVRKGRRLNKAERLFINIAEESGSHWMVNRSL